MYLLDKYTYIKNPFVEENIFRAQKASAGKLPTFSQRRGSLPNPFWDGHESAIGCYWKVWEIAFSNLRKPTRKNGFVSGYIDTAFNDHLFMWDSAFICQFAKYGMRAFNFLGTLDNIYAKQHPDGYICREIDEKTGQDCFQRHDPASTGPNVLAWTEWDYYLMFGDRKRLACVFPPLLAYYQWMKRYRSWPDGTAWSSGWGCGMDNQPRLDTEGEFDPVRLRQLSHFAHGHMSWIDACFQQVMSANFLMKMARELEREHDIPALRADAESLARIVNKKMWDKKTAFYYDRYRSGRLSGVKSIAAYWGLLANAVPGRRLGRFISHLSNAREFSRPHRVPTLSADHPDYRETGNYWNGAVWAPTNYMVLRGLSDAGYHGLAHEIGMNHLGNVVKVYERTGTVWENYSPEKTAPGKPAKEDFVGWSGLGPVSVFFEYVLGIVPDVPKSKITWRLNLLDEHGIENYPFGKDGRVSLRCRARKDARETPRVEIISNVPVKVELAWDGGKKTVKAKPF